ncbi:MAG: hypothetical protein SGCHY_001335 [Lobulomycetales sp.]
MRVIVAADASSRGIGCNGTLPWKLPTDMTYFRRITAKSILIMGRKTWTSIGAKPLPGRTCLVISSTLPPSDTVFPTLDAALASISASEDRQVWVIGGSRLYEQAMRHPRTSHIHLTIVSPPMHIPYDTFLPEIPADSFALACPDVLASYCREKGFLKDSSAALSFPRFKEDNGVDIEFQMYIRK